MRLIRFCLIILLFGIAVSCYKETINFAPRPDENLQFPLVLRLNGKDCFIDQQYHTLRYSLEPNALASFRPFVEFKDGAIVSFEGKRLKNNEWNTLGTVEYKRSYEIVIMIANEEQTFSLSFTNLPIVQVATLEKVRDEPKHVARLTINYPAIQEPSITSYIGIEYRGGISTFYPKRSYGFDFLSAQNVAAKKSEAFFDWPAQEDWILDGMYIDQARCRNALSFELWQAMTATHAESHSISTRPVELFVNNQQQGLYSLNQQMSPQKIGITNPESVLYKSYSWGEGATSFDQFRSSSHPHQVPIWDGWEQKHPNKNTAINWQPLYDFRTLIVRSSDSIFRRDLAQQVDIDLLIDYYIQMNVAYGQDNSGKNLIWLQRKPNMPFVIIPWDMDATWGRGWDGNSNNSSRILTNGLYKRMIALDVDDCRQRMKDRWNDLHSNVCSSTNLELMIEQQFSPLFQSDIIDLDMLHWGQSIDLIQEKTIVKQWMNQRLVDLDQYFNSL